MSSLIKLIDLPVICDDRGSLVTLENSKIIPFDIERVYYLYNLEQKAQRGFHAHINLQQIAICISGSCDFLLDDGNCRQTINLNSPEKGLLIDKLIWREMYNFSIGCVLLVIASDVYKEADYIRDYEKFIKIIKHDQ